MDKEAGSRELQQLNHQLGMFEVALMHAKQVPYRPKHFVAFLDFFQNATRRSGFGLAAAAAPLSIFNENSLPY